MHEILQAKWKIYINVALRVCFLFKARSRAARSLFVTSLIPKSVSWSFVYCLTKFRARSAEERTYESEYFVLVNYNFTLSNFIVAPNSVIYSIFAYFFVTFSRRRDASLINLTQFIRCAIQYEGKRDIFFT